MEIFPFPVILKQRANKTSIYNASILVQFHLNETVPSGAKVEITVVQPGLIPMQMFEGEYLVDELLEMFSEYTCPDHVPSGQTCATPLIPGVYGGDPPAQQFPPLPDDLAFNLKILKILNGHEPMDIEVKATVILEDNTVFTCIYVRTLVYYEFPVHVKPPRTTTTAPNTTTTPRSAAVTNNFFF